MTNEESVIDKIFHKYSESELIDILINIANYYEKDNKESIKIIKDKEYIKIRVSETISTLLSNWSTQRFIGKMEKPNHYHSYSFTRLETMTIIYIYLFGKGKSSILSKSKKNTKSDITFRDLNEFYKGLSDFLLDEKFKINGEWYNYEKQFLKPINLSNNESYKLLLGDEPIETIYDFTENDVKYSLESLQKFSSIIYYNESIPEKCFELIKTRMEALLPKEEQRKIPIFDFFEKEKIYNLEFDIILDELDSLSINLERIINEQFDLITKKIKNKNAK
ncbi:MAG: hypothetical protein IJS03_00100 [Eubacterium sp.]|nr:hypothetical protein [Eubacterium sp.]